MDRHSGRQECLEVIFENGTVPTGTNLEDQVWSNHHRRDTFGIVGQNIFEVDKLHKLVQLSQSNTTELKKRPKSSGLNQCVSFNNLY